MSDDGRYIDSSIAILEGEAAHQKTSPERNEPLPEERLQPAATAASAGTYYGKPAIKPPVWIWSVPAYFFVGGVAGAAMTLGLATQLAGGSRLRHFEERCRWIGAVGGGIGSALLIYDLGRKERFLMMLRVFRPTSPMSIGSWVLALATPLSAGSALLTMSKGWLYDLGYAAGMGAGFLGLPLATYTAVLLSNSAVPLWLGARRTLPFLFGASSIASLGCLLDLMPLDRRESAIALRVGVLGRAAELVAADAVAREVSMVPQVALPLKEGLSGTLWRAARLLTAASLALALLPGKSRRRRVSSGVLGILGGLALRYAVFHAGKKSSHDPLATFQQQRSSSPAT